MQDTLTLDLIKPVTFGGQTYEKLDLAEPTAGQLEKAMAGSNNVAVAVLLIAEVAKIPAGAVRCLCKRDLEAANAFLSGFSSADQGTGNES